MYEEAKEKALAPYAFAVEGSPDAAACVVFAEELPEAAHGALAAACAGIGLDAPCFFDAAAFDFSAAGGVLPEAAVASSAPAAAGGEVPGAAAGSDAASFGAHELFAAVEALDPLVLVMADEHAASLMSTAYREPVLLDAHGFLFGRPYAAFSSFGGDLHDLRAKQRNWAVLKALRKSADWLG